MRHANSLSIVIPAYNEALRLPESLEAILEYLYRGAFPVHEVIVVDDGSFDSTPLFLRDALDHGVVRSVSAPRNGGKGRALQQGVLAAQGEYVLCTDADLSTPIQEVEKLLPRITHGGFDVAIGSRQLPESDVLAQPLYRRALGLAGNWLIRTVLGLPFKDTQCGFKLYKRSAAVRLFERLSMPRFSYDYEVLARAKAMGLRVAEVGVRWRHAEGSSVRLSDVAQCFVDVFRVRAHIGGSSQLQALRFMAVGVVNTVVDAAAYLLLTRGFATLAGEPVTAKLFSFLLATISSLYLNRRWTFGLGSRLTLSEVVRFYASVSAGLMVNVAAMYFFVHMLGMHDLIAFALSTAFVFVANYSLAKFWVFRAARERAPAF